jgi:hypothetical protein
VAEEPADELLLSSEDDEEQPASTAVRASREIGVAKAVRENMGASNHSNYAIYTALNASTPPLAPDEDFAAR